MAINQNQRLWQLYQECRQPLYSYALSLTRDSASAEDAVHSSIVKLAQLSHTPRHLKAYLYRTVRNEALRLRRQAVAMGSLDGPEEWFLESFEQGPQQQNQNQEELQLLAKALDQLPEAQKEVIVLRVYSGLRFWRIADILEEPLATITTRYRRAIAALTLMMKECLHDAKTNHPRAQAGHTCTPSGKFGPTGGRHAGPTE